MKHYLRLLGFLSALLIGSSAAYAELEFMVIDNNRLDFLTVDEVKKVLEEDDGGEQPGNLIFHEDFTKWASSGKTPKDYIEDCQEPTRGRVYCDSFDGWNIRRLHGAPNNDVFVSDIDAQPNDLFKLTSDGLELRAYPHASSSTGYYGAKLSTERGFRNLRYVRVEIVAKFPDFLSTSGIHDSFWLMPSNPANNPSAHPEFDMLEVITNNKSSGDVSMLFRNAKNQSVGYWDQQNVPKDYWNSFHKYTFDWKPDKLQWFVDDVLQHEAPNLMNEDMYLLITKEGGPSSNGDFPAGFLPNTLWPSRTVIKDVKIFQN